MKSSKNRDPFRGWRPDSILLPQAELSDLCQAVCTMPPKAVRCRTGNALGMGEALSLPFESEAIPWFEAGRLVINENQPGRYLQHAAHCYFVQDASSMLALELLDAQPHEIVADLCAAPGAKASHILERVGPGSGFLLANEPIKGRLPALRTTLGQVGFPRYAITQLDPQGWAPMRGHFDAVLVDAPCSGQSLVGRGKQKGAAFSPKLIDHSAARQKRILEEALQLVRPGGRLVYSTCTFATEENEGLIHWFLDTFSDWQVVEVPELEPWLSPLAPGGYRLWPHRDSCAGAYAIKLQRLGEAEQREFICAKHQRTPKEIENLPDVQFDFFLHREQQCFGWPANVPEQLATLSSAGPEVAYRPGKTWQPGHDMALRRDENWKPTTIELDDLQAQQFMMGSPLDAGEPGWCVVNWKGHPLGWVHRNERRANNGLPQSARLRFTPLF